MTFYIREFFVGALCFLLLAVTSALAIFLVNLYVLGGDGHFSNFVVWLVFYIFSTGLGFFVAALIFFILMKNFYSRERYLSVYMAFAAFFEWLIYYLIEGDFVLHEIDFIPLGLFLLNMWIVGKILLLRIKRGQIYF